MTSQTNDLLLQRPRTVDVLFINAYRFILQYEAVIWTSIVAFLVGRVSSGLANSNVKTFSDLIADVFNVKDRSVNWINWLIMIAIILLPVASRQARHWRKRQSYDSILISVLQRLKDKSIRKFNVIGADTSITLQKCPEMERGWRPDEIKIDYRNTEYHLPKELIESYQDYFKFFSRERGEDNPTVMLTERPVAWTDQSSILQLRTQQNRYSYSLFFWDRIVPNLDRYNPLINNLYESGEIDFPHNLCLHLVVMTSDNRALLTLRSKKVASDRGTWSCSIEENMRPSDISGDRSTTISRWMKRAILEELGISEQYYTDNDLKILSVFLEAHRLNISMVGLVTLDLRFEELKKIIEALPRNDYEFTDVDSITLPNMAKALLRSTDNYHPTSRYRMLMVLLHRYGEPNFARKFIELVTESEV